MSENQPSKDLLQRLASVDTKLDKLLNSQLADKSEDLAEIIHEPDAGGSPEMGPDSSEDADLPVARRAAPRPPKPLKFNAAISPVEADTILQKVQKINSDAELMERVVKLEKQNRKITILGSMFMTLVVLVLAAFTVLMVQANVFQGGVILHASKKVDSPQVSAAQEKPQVKETQPAESLAQVNDSQAAGSVGQESNPQPVESAAPIPEAKSAKVKAAAPVTYVGSKTSNKYHYPDCKYAARIKPYKLRVFHSVKEAREKGYIPCPHCNPPHSDKE